MMLKTVAVAALALTLGSVSAGAGEPLSADFQVTYKYAGEEHRLSDNTVPLLPGNVCYTWWLQYTPAEVPAEVVETLTLPEPLSDWGDLASDPDDGVEISADGKSAISTFKPDADAEGWFSKGWCAAEGDPLGANRIDVSVDGKVVQSFNFKVVAPEDYSWPPITQPNPSDRTVHDSW
jgi:hypothetical protein